MNGIFRRAHMAAVSEERTMDVSSSMHLPSPFSTFTSLECLLRESTCLSDIRCPLLKFRAMSDQSPLDLQFTTPSFIYTHTADGRVEVKVTRHDLTSNNSCSLNSLRLCFTSCFTYHCPITAVPLTSTCKLMIFIT